LPYNYYKAVYDLSWYNFWFIACKPCIAEIPELNEIHDKYKNNKDVVFASITFDKKDKVEKFLKNTPIKYAVDFYFWG